MSDEPLKFEEFRRRREKNVDLVACARCKKQILATTIRCPECGVHFTGAAEDFVSDPRSRIWIGWIVLAAMLLLAMLLGTIGLQ